MTKLNKDEAEVKIAKLLAKFSKQARMVNEKVTGNNVAGGVITYQGIMNSFVKTLWSRLPEDEFMVTYLPKAIQESIDELVDELEMIEQKEVMDKLESNLD